MDQDFGQRNAPTIEPGISEVPGGHFADNLVEGLFGNTFRPPPKRISLARCLLGGLPAVDELRDGTGQRCARRGLPAFDAVFPAPRFRGRGT